MRPGKLCQNQRHFVLALEGNGLSLCPAPAGLFLGSVIVTAFLEMQGRKHFLF